jgi:esterase/lipase superfamily enzyme
MEMMPPPAIYRSGVLAVPDIQHRELVDGIVQLPFATLRAPAGADDIEPYYVSRRGSVLRLGIADVRAVTDKATRAAADASQPTDEEILKLTLSVPKAEELGVLPDTHPPFTPVEFDSSAAEAGPREFADLIDRTLLDGPGREIYVYVHGYKVVFENAVSVSTELWHFLDYEGAFIAFSWPSTPSRLAYLGDLETAEIAAITLRQFLEYLSAATQAQRIHVVGYSAGTRVVVSALAGLSLSRFRGPSAQQPRNARIGHVVLIGSDMDRALLGLTLADSVLDAVDDVTVYVSSSDKAMAISRRRAAAGCRAERHVVAVTRLLAGRIGAVLSSVDRRI